MNTSTNTSNRCVFYSGLCCGLLLLCFSAAMLHMGWYKWPDALVDYGRELYVPWQILNGKVLYRDIFHMYGPFAQYFNAMLFRLFGVGLSTLVTFNICCVAVVCILLGYLQRRMFGWFSVWVSLFVFIGVFAFGQYWHVGNFNFICPYSHDALYGLELSLLMFVCLWRVYDRPGVYRIAALGMVMGLILLTKVEIAVSAWSSAGVVMCLLAYQAPAFRKRSLLGAWLCGVTLPIAGFYLLFRQADGPAFAFRAIITSFTSPFTFGAVTKSVLYKQFSGLATPVTHSLLLLLVGLLELLLLRVGMLLSRLSSSKTQLAGTVIVLLILSMFFAGDIFPATELLRPLPLVLIIFCWKWNIKNPLHTGFAFFSFLLLLKIMLNVHAFGYGFLLTMPGATLLSGWLVSSEHWTKRVVALTSIALFVYIHVALSYRIYASKGFPVGEGRDRFVTYSVNYPFSQGRTYTELLPWLRSNIGPDEGMVVLPEGVMINYLARRTNPGKLFEFAPTLIEAMGEKRVFDLLRSSDPAYILITDRETTEHGARFFGKDYGKNIAEWMYRQYEPVGVFGAEPLQGKGFGIKLLKRRKCMKAA